MVIILKQFILLYTGTRTVRQNDTNACNSSAIAEQHLFFFPVQKQLLK